ncbi:MAG: uroporphyrinogen-III synthase/uroporphyrinogen-III C-methyltransferase, partial [Chthonomonadales bacterium]|nr:uroporphyrinogen-III synthase/uroporphyrinogen-III C-methyltransferase [Chthonomonadales bacterium]
HPSLLQYVRADAEKVYVGKASAQHAMKQPDINTLIIARAKEGKSVARLKGGDPFVFGRGGEEAEECRAAGVPFQIVPGVTSAIAAPAYAGIPVTHRDAASSFAVITGHERDDARESGTRLPGEAEGRRNWAHIAYAADTLVFLMGVEALPEIAARLQEHGRSPETPVALVQWGTWAQQRVVTGTLADIVEVVKSSGLTPPAVCVVGEVVKLRPALRWFDDAETRPLHGKRILVTRAREQASSLVDLLRAKGADPIEFPVIRIAHLEDYSALDAALKTLGEFDWAVFTSINAVPIVAERLRALDLDARAFHSTKIAALGPATANALREHLGLRADFVPTEAVAEAMLAQWPEADLTDKRLLFPRAKDAREILPEQLVARGATVDLIPVYETQFDGDGADDVRRLLQEGRVDAVTFTSASTVQNFAQAVATASQTPTAIVGKTPLVAIGPVTADAAQALDLSIHSVAEEHTIPGLVAALEKLWSTENA